MDSSDRSKSLIWWGTTRNGLGWLSRRTQQWYENKPNGNHRIQQVDLDDCKTLFELAEAGWQRVIIACENRWDYPHTAINQLLVRYPEIPVALAMSDWWLGWRRTGIGHFGPMPIVCLPWFRWWDGWVQWHSGSNSEMLGPFPGSIPYQKVDQKQRSMKRVLIVGRCGLTVQTWRHLLGHEKYWTLLDAVDKSDFDRAGTYEDNAGADLEPQVPDWILWDDSRIDTVSGIPERRDDMALEAAVGELSQIVRRFPNALLWVAWTQPTWDIVHWLEDAGLRFELLGKPYFASFSTAALDRM